MRLKSRLAALSFALSPAFAFACTDASTYSVDNISFTGLSLRGALSEVLRQTPLRIAGPLAEPPRTVSARAVGGRLDAVLDGLLHKYDLAYVQAGCDIVVVHKHGRVLRLMDGDLIHARLGDWLSGLGYKLVWEAPWLRVGGSHEIEHATLDAVLSEVVSIVGAGGAKVFAEIYSNRVIRIKEAK